MRVFTSVPRNDGRLWSHSYALRYPHREQEEVSVDDQLDPALLCVAESVQNFSDSDRIKPDSYHIRSGFRQVWHLPLCIMAGLSIDHTSQLGDAKTCDNPLSLQGLQGPYCSRKFPKPATEIQTNIASSLYDILPLAKDAQKCFWCQWHDLLATKYNV